MLIFWKKSKAIKTDLEKKGFFFLFCLKSHVFSCQPNLYFLYFSNERLGNNNTRVPTILQYLVVITRNTVRSFPNGHRNVSFVLWLDHKKRLIAIKMSHDRKHVDHHYCKTLLLLWLSLWNVADSKAMNHTSLLVFKLQFLPNCWKISWMTWNNTVPKIYLTRGVILATTTFSHEILSSKKNLFFCICWVKST